MKYKLFLLALFTFVSCSDSNNKLIEKLKTTVETAEKSNESYTLVDFAQLTDFEWDTLYHFHQLDDKHYISRQIGFKWDGAAVPNLSRRLLFVKDGKVVSYTDYELSELPITLYGCAEDRWVYPRSRARFATFKYCKGDEHSYPFIPVPCIESFREMMGTVCPEPETK